MFLRRHLEGGLIPVSVDPKPRTGNSLSKLQWGWQKAAKWPSEVSPPFRPTSFNTKLSISKIKLETCVLNYIFRESLLKWKVFFFLSFVTGMFVFCFFFSDDIRSVWFPSRWNEGLIEETDDGVAGQGCSGRGDRVLCMRRSSPSVRLETVVCSSGYCVELSVILAEVPKWRSLNCFFCVSTQHHADSFLLFWKFPSFTNPTSWR